jgi:internalin A
MKRALKIFIVLSILIMMIICLSCRRTTGEIVIENEDELKEKEIEENKRLLEETQGYQLESFSITDKAGRTWTRMNVDENHPIFVWCNENNLDLKNVQYSMYDEKNAFEIKIKNQSNLTIEKVASRWTTLEILSLRNCDIESLEGIEKIPTLRKIDLSNNKIKDISPLAKLDVITHLNLSSNEVEDISPLKKFTMMVHLNAEYNKISDISPIKDLWNLDTLILDANNISDITPIIGLNNLITLKLSSNKISDISPIANLKNLEILYLDENNISDIMPLFELKGPKELLLYKNPISDRKYIKQLEKKFDLKGIYD